jgi:hypothetical protein
MAELIDIFNAMLKNKKDWVNITDDDKIKYSFIFTRYFSKRYTEQAAFMNLKGIDKVLVMDLWYNFMLKEPFPRWFWSKSDSKDKPTITDKELKSLIIKLKVKPEDISYLIDKHPEFIKEELDYIKKIEKQK